MNHVTLAIACLVLGGCAKPSMDADPAETEPVTRLVILTREGCVNSPRLLANLESAVASFQPPMEYTVLDQGTLPADDPRAGYGTPTILWRNRDLFGMPEPARPLPAPS